MAGVSESSKAEVMKSWMTNEECGTTQECRLTILQLSLIKPCKWLYGTSISHIATSRSPCINICLNTANVFLMQLQQSIAVRGHRAHSTTWRPPPSKTLRAGKQLWLAQIWDNTRQVCLGKKKNRKNAAFLYLRIASNQKYPCLPPLTADFRYCKALQRL